MITEKKENIKFLEKNFAKISDFYDRYGKYYESYDAVHDLHAVYADFYKSKSLNKNKMIITKEQLLDEAFRSIESIVDLVGSVSRLGCPYGAHREFIIYDNNGVNPVSELDLADEMLNSLGEHQQEFINLIKNKVSKKEITTISDKSDVVSDYTYFDKNNYNKNYDVLYKWMYDFCSRENEGVEHEYDYNFFIKSRIKRLTFIFKQFYNKYYYKENLCINVYVGVKEFARGISHGDICNDRWETYNILTRWSCSENFYVADDSVYIVFYDGKTNAINKKVESIKTFDTMITFFDYILELNYELEDDRLEDAFLEYIKEEKPA